MADVDEDALASLTDLIGDTLDAYAEDRGQPRVDDEAVADLTDAILNQWMLIPHVPVDDASKAQRRSMAAESIYQRQADGYHAVMHECIEPPMWNRTESGREDTEPLTADEVAWMRGELS